VQAELVLQREEKRVVEAATAAALEAAVVTVAVATSSRLRVPERD
jgi:hypothetical protein